MENNKKRACILGYPVDLYTKEQALDYALGFMANNKNLHVVTINPEIILAAEKNQELDAIIKRAQLIIPDSTGMELALRKTGHTEAKKTAGIEFSETLIGLCVEKGYNLAFIGSTQEVIEKLEQELKLKYPDIKIVFTRNGYFEQGESEEIINQIKEKSPQLLLVALGAPKQEIFITQCMQILNGSVMIGVGGSFDVWAKKVKRAPVIFRMFGLEWFYRLIKQPSRFNRMFPALPLFIARTAFLKENCRKEY